jgi:hypothetical protein
MKLDAEESELLGSRSFPSARRLAARVPAFLPLALAFACNGSSPSDAPPTALAEGTWGGEEAGVIAEDEVTHVHVGCTYGDFPGAIALDAAGRFSIPGEYQLRAYPVVMGPPMPAQFAGVVRGGELTFTVAVNDTIEKVLVVRGPVTVTYGREPAMANCPICADPSAVR